MDQKGVMNGSMAELPPQRVQGFTLLNYSDVWNSCLGCFFSAEGCVCAETQVVEEVWGAEWEEIIMLILADEYRKPQRVLSYSY